MYEYKPSKYVENKCVEFAESRMVLSANLYKWRGEKNLGKMQEDIMVGTLGEYGVANYVRSELGRSCSRPDLKIYENKRKSFDADLTSEDLIIHVKSQSSKSIKRYGKSWLLQRKDKLVSNPKSNEYFAFTSVDVDTNLVTVLGFVHCRLIKDLKLYGECKVPRYRHSKVALYLDDLEPYGIIEKGLN